MSGKAFLWWWIAIHWDEIGLSLPQRRAQLNFSFFMYTHNFFFHSLVIQIYIHIILLSLLNNFIGIWAANEKQKKNQHNYQAQTGMCWGSSCSLKLNLNKLCNSQKFPSLSLSSQKIFFCYCWMSLRWNIETFFLPLYHFLCLIRCHNLKIYLFSTLFCVFIFTFHVFSAEKNQWDYIFLLLLYLLSCLCRNNGSMLLFRHCYYCCCCCCIFNGFILWMREQRRKKNEIKIFGVSL